MWHITEANIYRYKWKLHFEMKSNDSTTWFFREKLSNFRTSPNLFSTNVQSEDFSGPDF